jgi:purine-nucleoside phosphorylase
MRGPVYTRADYKNAAQSIRQRTNHQPKVGLILGSGLGSVANAVETADVISYADVPNYPTSQVEGHGNRFVIGKLNGANVIVLQGRSHYYEGWDMQQVTFSVRVMAELGVQVLIVTNSAGGLNPDYKAGDLMLIRDHINFPGLAGINPLRGHNDPELGVRFPDMTIAYDRELRATSRQVAEREGFILREGVYVGLGGPNYETPAEIRMLRVLGADAVGMSTVHEVVAARHAGLRVLGFSGISNECIAEQDAEKKVVHEEVLEVGRIIVPKLVSVIYGVLATLAD